jgi:F0F1-type ATP synthase assembly protein I
LKKRTQFGFESQKRQGSQGHPLIWLGKYLSLGLTLPAAVFAGYILGAFADHFLHIPFLRALGIILGMVAGLVQILRELSREGRK